jgi:hypothetical protein
LLHIAGRGGRDAPAVFHGHGAGGEVDKVLLDRYLRAVDEGLRSVLRDEHAPLVLASVGYEQAMFRQVTHYPYVLADGVDGNPDELSAEQLHQRAWLIVSPVLTRAREEATARFRSAAGRGGAATTDVEEIVRAATEGRVDTLFVPPGEHRWGSVDALSHQVAMHADPLRGDEDLLDRAAVWTLLNAGTVFAVPAADVPGPGPAAALLRY